MSFLADLLSIVFERRYRHSESKGGEMCPIEELTSILVGSAGETSGVALARDILTGFGMLGDEKKLDFFRHIATAMNIDPERVRETLEEYERNPSRSSYREFMRSAEPRRQELVRRLNGVPGATGYLVKMREDLLKLGRGEAELEALDLDFCHLFSSWFNRGFLVLRPISWESPAHILEKIIAYEAVHAIDSWDDLRRRLEPKDRRCFSFFHPSMPDEPLIFVEVALTMGISKSVQELLAEDREAILAEDADTAVFYSISNCQAGLAGISFGDLLIKQVVSDLAAEFTGLKRFVTLSPIPGLMVWLEKESICWEGESPDEKKAIAGYYLLRAKDSRGFPFDSVERFHLGNGAIVHGVHADADISDKGKEQSGGVMVNYLYDVNKIAPNHEKFVTKKEIAVSHEVEALAGSIHLSPLRERKCHDKLSLR